MKTHYRWLSGIFGRYCWITFYKKTDFNGTVLGTIVLTAYKETNQQIINLPLELSSIMSLICRAVKSVGPLMFWSGRWTTVHLSVYDFVWQSVSYLTLACTDVGWLTKNIDGQINVFGMLVFHQLIFIVKFPKIWNERILWITAFIWSQQSSFQLTQFLPMFTPFSFDMKHQTDIHVWYIEIS